MNILLLVHGLPVGGTEMMVCHLARRLRVEGHDVAIGCLDLVGELGLGLEAEGFPVELYGRKPGLDLGLPGRIARAVKRRAFDVVHAHQYTCFFYGVLAKMLTGAPLVFTEHGRFYPDRPSVKRRVFNFLFSRRADRVTAVSNGVKESLRRIEGFAADRIEVVYNGIDVDRLARSAAAAKGVARSRFGVPPLAKVVGTVGRLDPIKNHALLLHAFAAVARRMDDALLLIAGEGPELDRLRALSASLDIEGRVRFLGKRSDIDQVLAALDVFALSSFSEGTPMTLIEAMAASVPIVSTAVGGVPEIVRDGVEGLLVSGTPSDLTRGDRENEYVDRYAAALIRALTDPACAAELARHALARAKSDFSLDAIAERYVAIYRQAAPSPKSRQLIETRK
jgi:glycosyltransferase involved in cell wall biosynthesis